LIANAVETSSTSIPVGEMTTILKQNDIDIIQDPLFEWLRTKGYLMKKKSSDYNMPTQRSMELKLFEISESVTIYTNGKTITNLTPMITRKGQNYFVKNFLT
jgi:anti-repressor protein